jgi:hypothetical protein
MSNLSPEEIREKVLTLLLNFRFRKPSMDELDLIAKQVGITEARVRTFYATSFRNQSVYRFLTETLGYSDDQMSILLNVPDDVRERVIFLKEEAERAQAKKEKPEDPDGSDRELEDNDQNNVNLPIREIQRIPSNASDLQSLQSDVSDPSGSSSNLQTPPPRGSPRSEDPRHRRQLEVPTPTGVIEDTSIVPIVQRTGERYRMPDGKIVEIMVNDS